MQVTNPPIDPLREGLVMSLEMTLGKRENILEINKEHANSVSRRIRHLPEPAG